MIVALIAFVVFSQLPETSASQLVISPDVKWLVLAAHIDRKDGSDIYAISTDGKQFKRLTTKGNNLYPNINSDGNLVAFLSDMHDTGPEIVKISDIYVTDLSGNSPHRLTDYGAQFGPPIISTDSSAILFSSNVYREDGDTDLFIYEFDSGDVTQLTKSGDNSSAVWSPDGEQVAYTHAGNIAGESGTFRADLYLVDRDGDNTRRLTTEGGVHKPVFSPDGKTIAFTKSGATTDSVKAEVCVIDADGKNRRTLTAMKRWCTDLSFSPDSKSILFTSQPTEGLRPMTDVHVVTVAEGKVSDITSVAWISRTSFFGDGKAILLLAPLALGPVSIADQAETRSGLIRIELATGERTVIYEFDVDS